MSDKFIFLNKRDKLRHIGNPLHIYCRLKERKYKNITIRLILFFYRPLYNIFLGTKNKT